MARSTKNKNRTSPPGAGPTTLINAHLIDPATGLDEPGGLVIENETISDLGPHLRRDAQNGSEIIDCMGHILCPGLIDMVVFTGEPGSEHRETLETASLAAAAGGVTTMICMPDTDPVIDDVSLVDFIERRARDTAVVNVHPMAALTKGLRGEDMTEIGLLREAGALAFSNGKKSVMNARVMRNLLSYARDFDALVVHHTEDSVLAGDGVMNEGEVSSRLGLPGIPAAAETIMVERDIRLVELSGGRYHAAQISCQASLEAIRGAKARGLPVTCGVSINHLTLNEHDINPYRTFFKLRPPLRSEADRLAMIEGVRSGDIDVVVSAHDPQDVDAKRRPFAEAEDGAIGLETLLIAGLRLYHNKDLSMIDLIRPLTITPAELLGLKAGRLAKGAPADLVLFDPDPPIIILPDQLHSRSKNTPFDESKLQGRILRTMVAGKTVHEHANTGERRP